MDYRQKFIYCESFEDLLFLDFDVSSQLHEDYCVLIVLFGEILSVMSNNVCFTYCKENYLDFDLIIELAWFSGNIDLVEQSLDEKEWYFLGFRKYFMWGCIISELIKPLKFNNLCRSRLCRNLLRSSSCQLVKFPLKSTSFHSCHTLTHFSMINPDRSFKIETSFCVYYSKT